MRPTKTVFFSIGPAQEKQQMEVTIKNGRPIAPAGARSFYVRYTLPSGQRVVKALGQDLNTAFVAFQNYELNQERIKKGLLPVENPETGNDKIVQVRITDAAAQFIKDCESRIQDWRKGADNGLSPASVKVYRRAIQDFVESCKAFGAVNMSEFEDRERGVNILMHFKGWLNVTTNVKRRGGKGAYTDRKKFMVIGQFLAAHNIKMTKDRVFSPSDPGLLKRTAVPYVKPQRISDVVFYTPSDIKAMLSAAATIGYNKDPHKFNYDADDLRDLVLILLWTGMRDEELQHLEWSDIVWQNGDGNGKILVQDKPAYDWRPKNKQKRPIRMTLKLRNLLKARQDRMKTQEWKDNHEGQSETLVFSNSFGEPNENFDSLIMRLQNQAALGEVEREPGGPRRPYEFSRPECRKKVLLLFRHTYATMLDIQGKPARSIQEALGHGQLTTTERYLGVAEDPEQMRKDFESIGDSYGKTTLSKTSR